jgi:hypothetical protein
MDKDKVVDKDMDMDKGTLYSSLAFHILDIFQIVIFIPLFF